MISKSPSEGRYRTGVGNYFGWIFLAADLILLVLICLYGIRTWF